MQQRPDLFRAQVIRDVPGMDAGKKKTFQALLIQLLYGIHLCSEIALHIRHTFNVHGKGP